MSGARPPPSTRASRRSSTSTRWCARGPQLERVISEIQAAPGPRALHPGGRAISASGWRAACRESSSPCLSVLQPVHDLLQAYLGDPEGGAARRPAHAERRVLQAHRRDELHPGPRRRQPARGPRGGRRDPARGQPHLEDADLDLPRQSRPQDHQPAARARDAAAAGARAGAASRWSSGLFASPERIVQIRQNRLLSLNADDSSMYVDRTAVADEITASRRLFTQEPLADHRRDPPLDRGDGRRDRRPLPRPPAEVHRGMTGDASGRGFGAGPDRHTLGLLRPVTRTVLGRRVDPPLTPAR